MARVKGWRPGDLAPKTTKGWKVPPGSAVTRVSVGAVEGAPYLPPTREAVLHLPFPPTLNTYWRHIVVNGQARTLISAKGRAYREKVKQAVGEQKAGRVTGRLLVRLVCHPPDRRQRDLDNLPKALLDSICAAGVILNDANIDELVIVRGAVAPGGRVFAVISTLA